MGTKENKMRDSLTFLVKRNLHTIIAATFAESKPVLG